MSDSLGPHGLQHPRLPCSSPTLRAYSNSCHRVGDSIQPSHRLSSPSPPAFNLSQHQSLFKLVNSSHQVAKVLEFQLLPSVLPMNIQDWFPLGLTGWTQRFISIVIMFKSRNFSCAGNAGVDVDFQLRFFTDLKVYVPKFKVLCPPHTKIKWLG